MVKDEALRRAMSKANVTWSNLFGTENEEVTRFFANAVEQIAFGHTQPDQDKPWMTDASVSYAAWEWDQHRSLVESEYPPNVLAIVGYAKIWDYPLPFGYSGLGEAPVAADDLLGLAKLRLVCAADKVTSILFTSAGIKDEGDLWRPVVA